MSINIAIIAVSTLVSGCCFKRPQWFYRLAFVPVYNDRANAYRWFSYGLVHADWGHLLVNMFVLWCFGAMVEDAYRYMWNDRGMLLYLLLYVTALPISTYADGLRHREDTRYVAVGASGAVSAVVFASILLFPLKKFYIMFVPIGIPAVLFGIMYLLYEVYMDKKANDHVGHKTHVWGAIYGFIFALIFRPRLLVAFVVQILQVF